VEPILACSSTRSSGSRADASWPMHCGTSPASEASERCLDQSKPLFMATMAPDPASAIDLVTGWSDRGFHPWRELRLLHSCHRQCGPHRRGLAPSRKLCGRRAAGALHDHRRGDRCDRHVHRGSDAKALDEGRTKTRVSDVEATSSHPVDPRRKHVEG